MNPSPSLFLLRGLAAPKRLGEGGTCRVEVPRQRNVDGFTLIEIMIVVMIVAILSLLAMIAVGRIKERAARTVILNNLRQLYDAKEFYFSENPSSSADVVRLAARGYISATVKERLTTPRSYEAALGWHYSVTIKPGESVFAYKGVLSANNPTGDEAIYYPDAEGRAAAKPPPAPAGPALPPGFVGGNNPNAPIVKPPATSVVTTSSMNGALEFQSILSKIEIRSPDGSPTELVALSGDAIRPSSIGTWQGKPFFNLGWNPEAQASNPPKEYQFMVTVRNAQGETQVPIIIKH